MKMLQSRIQSILAGVVISLVAVSSSACQNNNQVEKAEKVFEPVPLNELVTAVPDTIASPEQLALKRKIEHIIYFKTVVKDNHFELTVDKDYFIQNDIPLTYYDLLVENLEANNKLADELKSQGHELNVAEMFEESKKEYEAYIKKFDKSTIEENN
ncbi:MAG: hypothetical protein HDR82_06275 [Bacteroides sp.]|nr:hypothetical protein [Bacteroides sp.]